MRKKLLSRLIIGAFFSITLFGLLWLKSAHAASASFSYDTNVTYTALDQTTMHVEERYIVTNNTARQYLTELKLTTPSDKLSELKVRYDDGTTIPTKLSNAPPKSDGSLASQQIVIEFPRVNAGSGQRWQFVVTYNTAGLIETKGSSHTVYVPALDEADQRSSYNVTVDVPDSFGTPHFNGSNDALVLKGDGRQVYGFSRADLVNHSLALVFGDSTIYNVTFNAPLHNASPVPRKLTVTLPPDLSTQSTIIKSIKPAPTTTRLDADGNVLAEYNLAAYQKLTVVVQLEGQVNYRDYNLAKSGTAKDIPSDLVANYTKATHYWQTTGDVAAAAKSVTKPEAKVVDNVHAIYRYVIDKLTYNNDKIKFNVRQGAFKALINPQNAICLEYADLMIAMLRSQGIPARMVVGYAYAGSIKSSPAVADSLHAWVEAYVPNLGWMTVDPTWGEKFDDFGRSDLDHYAFAVWGRSDSSPGAVMIGANDTGYQYENTQLSFSSSKTSLAPSGAVSIDRYTLLPFLSVDRVHVAAQPQSVTTGNQLIVDGQAQSLGTLAPGQKLTITQLKWGSGWNQPVAVELKRSGAVLAKASAHVYYWPMFALATSLVAVWLLYMLRLRSKQRASRVKKIYTDNRRKSDVLDE